MYGGCKNKTIYGNSGVRSIYGGGCTTNTQALCDYKPILQGLQTLTQAILTVVAEFFPSTTVKAQLVGTLGGNAYVAPALFVRMYWLKTHPGKTLTTSEYDQLELIDIYLKFPGLDWKTDQYITVKLDETGMNGS